MTYSAYFLSLDFITIYIVMCIILTLVYLGLAFSYWRGCRANKRVIDNFLQEMGGDDNNLMRPSLEIKYTMLR